MRKPQYLSPSALMTYIKDPTEYYLKYLGPRLPSIPQTQPMAAGSAFDFEVKKHIADRIFGTGSAEYQRLAGMFESAVEVHNRDWARGVGHVCMEAYTKSGALSRLMALIGDAEPIMESTIRRDYAPDPAHVGDHIGGTWLPKLGKSVWPGLSLLGKPDIFFWKQSSSSISSSSDTRIPVIIDWKVNGYCSKASPKAGYQILLDSDPDNGKPPKAHKDYVPMITCGIEHDMARFFETVYPDWALQTATYAWVCQPDWTTPVCPVLVGIDQLACDSSTNADKPKIRVAQHRGRVSLGYQEKAWRQYQDLWHRIQAEHIFDMPIEESRAMQHTLDGGSRLEALDGLGDSIERPRDDAWMADLLQSSRRS